MFCPNCGKEIPDGSRFCTQCGNPTGESVKVVDDTPVPVDDTPVDVDDTPV